MSRPRTDRGEVTFEPLVEMGKYLRGEMSVEAWRERWSQLGLADQRLASQEPRPGQVSAG